MEVFTNALGLEGKTREDYLDEACPTSQARARIEQLLRHHAEAPEEFLTQSVDSAEAGDVPEQIDEFRIIKRLGEGGMGVVYLAKDTTLDRNVALKILHGHVPFESAAIRFQDEARSAATLKHPGIVPVFRFGSWGEQKYLVTEFVDGPTLAQLIDTQKQAITQTSTPRAVKGWLRRVAEISLLLAEALEAAHRGNVVHRDVKPSNILMDAQLGPRLTDFGIAKHFKDQEPNIQTGLIGSCHYMSPEQANIEGARVDFRSDIFSLGVVLYEMLTFVRPFEGDDIH